MPKLSRDEKKAARGAKRAQRRETWSNLRQAFTLTRRVDNKLIWMMASVALLAAAIVFALAYLFSGNWWMSLVLGIMAAILGALLTFSRRAQRSMYAQAEGQPGAAGWMLSQRLRGDWRVQQGVVGTAQLDAVHRLVGRPGIVLVGEGSPTRIRGLIATEKRNLARVAGDTPIYDLIVGTGEGEVSLAKLNRALLKLPSNLNKDEVNSMDKRLQALTGGRMPVPAGPLPQGAKMRNVQRAARRAGR